MFRPMVSIFSSRGLAALFAAAFVVLAGCAKKEPEAVTPPKEAAAVIAPFLQAVAAGERAKAATYVSPAAMDEFEKLYAKNHTQLAKAGVLTPRFVQQKGLDPDRLNTTTTSAIGSEITAVYAVKKGEKWTTATVRVYKYRDDPYKVEYWQITNKAPVKPQFNVEQSKAAKQAEMVRNAMIIGFALLGLCGILLLVWLSQRKPHILAPSEQVETRRSATTVRDTEG